MLAQYCEASKESGWVLSFSFTLSSQVLHTFHRGVARIKTQLVSPSYRWSGRGELITVYIRSPVLLQLFSSIQGYSINCKPKCLLSVLDGSHAILKTNKQLKNAVIVTDLWWDFVFVGLVLGWVWAFFFIFQT